MTLQLLQVFQKSRPIPLSLFYTRNREYYEWIWRLKRHIQVIRLPFQVTWLSLVAQSVILGSMWPIGQTSNNSVINIRWWRCPLPSCPSLALPHPNSWLETHFVLLLAKIIEYTVFQLSLSHWFVFIETSRQDLKNPCGLVKRSDSQPRWFMLSTINSFKLMIEIFVK